MSCVPNYTSLCGVKSRKQESLLGYELSCVRAFTDETDVQRLADSVGVSGTSLWCARKIGGSVVLLCSSTAGLRYSLITACNERAGK